MDGHTAASMPFAGRLRQQAVETTHTDFWDNLSQEASGGRCGDKACFIKETIDVTLLPAIFAESRRGSITSSAVPA